MYKQNIQDHIHSINQLKKVEQKPPTINKLGTYSN